MRALAYRPRAALLAVLALSACAGSAARKNVLLPTLRRAWTSASADVAYGIDAGVKSSRITAARGAALTATSQALTDVLAGDDHAAITAAAGDWPVLRAEGEAGIAAKVKDGKIGPAVAPSLLERLKALDEGFAKFLGGG